MRKLMVLPLSSLLTACAAQMPADSPQARAAFQVYETCLRNYAGSADDGNTNPEEVGVTLAGYCLQEFSRYRAISGVADSENERIATRVIIARRRH